MAAAQLDSPKVKFWKSEIDLYERTSEKWLRRGRRIYKRYKDVRSPREDAVTRFNVLWSNVQTRLPALYSRDPKIEVERRFRDKDPVGRQTAEILERAIDYTVRHCNPFGAIMRQAILDYELPGRGVVWLRYVPHFHKEELEPEQMKPGSGPGLRAEEGTDSDATGVRNHETEGEGDELTNDASDDVAAETLGYEETLVDYVYWEDFGYTWARTWEEVRAVWRRVYLTREEGIERFGEGFKDVALDWSPKNLNDAKVGIEQKKAVVYEIWDKQDHKVYWLCKTHSRLLDQKQDPLKLSGFFPCPRPLFANLCPDELLPVPNFTFYQDQANEIDELSTRISAIGKALKVAGVRDSSAEGLDRLLSEGVENQLVPVDGWMALKEKGGLAGVMELLPLKDIAEALGYLREQRKSMIDDVYEITGLSDIIRGLSDPNETATAQQIKGQFAVLRISDSQSEIQRFCRDCMRIMAEIIADYDIETLKQISGVKLLTQVEKDAIKFQMQLMSAMGGQPGGAPMPHPAAPGAGAPPMGGPSGSPPPQQAGGAPGPGGPPQAAPPAPGQPATPQNGQPAQQGPSISPEKLALLKEPTWEEVAALLENPVLREFRVDIETDSTIRTDEDADREARMSFIDAVSKMVGEAATVPPPMIPAVGELILFGIRGFKVARNLERVFEEAIEKLQNMPSRPDPEMMKAQMEAQTDAQVAMVRAKTDKDIAQYKAQVEAQLDQQRGQLELKMKETENAQKLQHEKALADVTNNFESQRVQYETQAKERMAQADNATKLQIEQMRMNHEKEIEQHKSAVALQTNEMNVKSKEKVAEMPQKGEHDRTDSIKQLTEALKAVRKPRKIVRGEKGEITEIH